MLLTITTSHRPATDLGHLLRKNPANVHDFELSFGSAHVFYPEASDSRCTAALLLRVDPVGLVRKSRGPSGEGGALDQYVNDRPYVCSSFLSVAIARVFGTAMTGNSKLRPELAKAELPFEVTLAVVPCRGGEPFLRSLFEPLGYTVEAIQLPLDEKFPEWGESRYFRVVLKANKILSELLNHLYVLIPVLDDEKHYWVSEDEVEKLLKRGKGWLAAHPERDAITRRYLRHQRSLMYSALDRLAEEDKLDEDEAAQVHAEEEQKVEERISLNQQRLGSVLGALRQTGAKRVLDLGCGEGRLLRMLLEEKSFANIVGMDVSIRALQMAQDRLRFERMPPKQRERIQLIHGSLMYRDNRLTGFDAAAVVEVVEHLDPPRLAAFERVLFEFAKPRSIVLTTPNKEYNVKFETLPAGKMRHKDHRFEWTRQEFQIWALQIANRFAYSVRFVPVGEVDPQLGPPTQMAIFDLNS
ncbi:MAG TPA: 3' terminal RNA ribose 2'-O-methyltransferase Hen1 [Candidatus Dormibacteraeota bacterium]|jgi:3' terminal RNA ribose 2'-O-methyltransferase Hen1|nr:3' terminal RNA ribose 2'-O-methyltransferase Hen1 [Candidatus Dormibacteraeota bacterium]